MDWTAKVRVGQSSADVVGQGALNVSDVIGMALGIGQLELYSVLVSESDHLMVGFRAGDKSGPMMMADVVIERRTAPLEG